MDNDTLIIDPDSVIKDNLINEYEDQSETVKYCLNCGTEVNDKFCPHCGQSTATPSKLKMKNFGKSVMMSFGRLTPGFFNTAKGLLLHPWDVIRDHIHGKHIRYSPPITMIIQIFLYATILFTFMNAVFGTSLNTNNSMFGYKGDNELLKMIDQSVVGVTFFIGIPICFAVYLAYYRHGSKKYNFAEYLAAFIYLYASINLYNIIFSFLNVIPGMEFDMRNLTIMIAIIFSVVVLIKAFPQKKWWKTVGLLIWTSFIIFISLILFSATIFLPQLVSRLSEI